MSTKNQWRGYSAGAIVDLEWIGLSNRLRLDGLQEITEVAFWCAMD
ncbi:hypothetical protein ACPOL_3019 [Acidisarcina polymorpha]|uniref:Mobile element protein n=1 Tax=Acidisarcina polymorpha TaxID=2211140 RepID=A0A2Z5FZL0_9BACT|nr:hypothetical protein ACPOL_3019 [Acidisarcina polymorpha]